MSNEEALKTLGQLTHDEMVRLEQDAQLLRADGQVKSAERIEREVARLRRRAERVAAGRQ